MRKFKITSETILKDNKTTINETIIKAKNKEEAENKFYNNFSYADIISIEETNTPTMYEILKEQAREKAIEWQIEASEKCLSYEELYKASEYFYKLAKRYGLIKEFKINGII